MADIGGKRSLLRSSFSSNIGSMTSTDRAAIDAMQLSMMGWGSLVMIPGMLFVFGLIFLVSPRNIPPSQSWANGTYVNPCCKPLILRDGTLETAGKKTHYTVEDSKFGNQIDVAAGIGVRRGNVEFGGNLVLVHFNNDSMARPAIHDAKSIHLFDLDDSTTYTFTKRI